MLTTIQQELASAWEAVADWTTYVLMREGLEGVALIPLARYPRAAEWIIRRETRSDEPRRRQIAAMLAGRLARPRHPSAAVDSSKGDLGVAVPGTESAVDPDLLSELFEQEARLVREVPHEDARAERAGMLESASVVAHIIDAAALWCRDPDLRGPGLELLRRILEAAIAGEGWVNLERAAINVAAHGLPEGRELLGRLHRTLDAGGEDSVARSVGTLLTGDLSAIADDRIALAYADRAAAEFQVAGEARDVLDRLLEAAAKFERG